MKIRNVVAGALLVPMLGAFAACGDDSSDGGERKQGSPFGAPASDAATETESGEPAMSAPDSESTEGEAGPAEPTDDVTEGMSSEETTEPSAPETYAVGDTAEVGDWSIKVSEVERNANKTIAGVNEYNDKAKGQYVLVTFEATYNGSERQSNVNSDLRWSLTGSDQQVVDTVYETTPADEAEWPDEARKGGTVKQQILFDLKPNLIKGSLLSVEGYDSNYDEVYADFAIE